MTLLSYFVVLNVFLSDQEDPADNNLMRYAYCSRRKVSFSPRGNALIAINAQHDCQLNVFWISLSFYKQDIWWICSGYVSKQHNHVCTGWCMGQKWTLRRRLPMRHLAEGEKWKFTWIFFLKMACAVLSVANCLLYTNYDICDMIHQKMKDALMIQWNERNFSKKVRIYFDFTFERQVYLPRWRL